VKVNTDRDTLQDAVAFVARSLPARPPVPVLGGITLTAGEHGLTLAAYDYETSALAQLGATIADDGAALISGHLLADIAKNLPKATDVDLALDGPRLRITCGQARFSLPTMPIEDYPQLPAMPPQVGEIDTEAFTDAVPQVAVAAAAESDAVPVLTGIELTPSGSVLTLAATNRFRLARRNLPWTPTSDDGGGGTDTSTEGVSLVAPARMLVTAAKNLDDAGTIGVHLTGDRTLLGLTGSRRSSTMRLLADEFPTWRKLIPTDYTASVRFDVEALADTVKRAMVVGETRDTRVRLDMDHTHIRVSAGGDDTGTAEETIPAELTTGEPFVVQFNPRYLTDALSVMHTSRVELRHTGSGKPAVLHPLDDNATPSGEYLHLLMPVRLPEGN
jgi:DNA polymerase-3 subunit beta